jgi:hypothetical protein
MDLETAVAFALASTDQGGTGLENQCLQLVELAFQLGDCATLSRVYSPIRFANGSGKEGSVERERPGDSRARASWAYLQRFPEVELAGLEPATSWLGSRLYRLLKSFMRCRFYEVLSVW